MLLLSANSTFLMVIENDHEFEVLSIYRLISLTIEFVTLQTIIFLFSTVLFKLKKIEIAINPLYASADAVLDQMRKFLCLTKSIIIIGVCFVILIVLFYIAFVVAALRVFVVRKL